MKLKKISAVTGLLSILGMIIHIIYQCYAYITMYYNPFLKMLTAIPVMIMVCIHAVLGMIIVFTRPDGTDLTSYPSLNKKTILQRVSAALIFPLLILHLNHFSLMQASIQAGQIAGFILLVLAEILFFAVCITHVSISFTKAFIMLGILSSEKTYDILDKIIYIIGGIVFAVSVVAVLRGQLLMFGLI